MKKRALGRIFLISLAFILVIGIAGYAFRDKLIPLVFQPTDSSVQEAESSGDLEISEATTNLDTPWSISLLPDGDLLVTERNGQLTRIGGDGRSFPVDDVSEVGEGGLLGVALDPDFASNHFIYVYYTTDRSGELTNQIDRYELDGGLKNRQSIIENIPAASNHNGGAIAFGPDGKLYVTTGDAAVPDNAQDTDSLAGKILRLNSDGTTPGDNPFSNPVWSYGHRNPQGIAWDDNDRLWSVEHGPSGAESGRDELNLIEKGGNYGWPDLTGDETGGGRIAPIVHSGVDDTWAPAGLAYYDGVLYFAGLRGQSLYRAEINDTGDDVTLSRMLSNEYGRLRAVTTFDGGIYVSTSNHDGRGSPNDGDDKILKLTNL